MSKFIIVYCRYNVLTSVNVFGNDIVLWGAITEENISRFASDKKTSSNQEISIINIIKLA